ncbi:carbohydrate sulfotransferase 10-like isoform X1 [Ciona intestinalis]
MAVGKKFVFVLCVALCVIMGIMTLNSLNTQVILEKYRTTVRQFSMLPVQKQQENCSSVQKYNDNGTADFMRVMATLHRERQDTLARACADWDKRQVGNEPIGNALFSKKYKFTACPIFKSGSSTFLRSMLEMEGVNQTPMKFDGLMAEGRKRRIAALPTAEKKQEIWDQYLNVILVRSPFERFVSAYTDKLVPSGRGYTYVYKPLSKKLRDQFISIRANVSERTATEEYATFEDFVNHLIRNQDGGRDHHWRSYEAWCSACNHGYDVIMKMETLSDDVRYVAELLGISPEHRNWFFPSSKPATDIHKTERFFETVPKNLSLTLYEMSKRDFDMFGYPKPNWLW